MLAINTPFWRAEPLSETENQLIRLLFDAHAKAVARNNPSSAAVINAGVGSGDYIKAITSAMLTLGGSHAPLIETYNFLRDANPTVLAKSLVAIGGKVPGWGSSFEKGKMDPDWRMVEVCFREYYPRLHDVLVDVTNALHMEGKMIFPNPSAYTACTAIALGIPAPLSPYLLIAARLDGWSELLLRHV